jgi:enoyl-CoA hydratase/carnithine racemase
MSVPAAVETAAAGLRLSLGEGLATITIGGAGGSGPGPPAMAAALAEIGLRLTGDIRVVVLRADVWSLPAVPAGQPVAGRDPPRDRGEAVGAWQAGVGWLSARSDLISVAGVRGRVSGAGLQLALACDLRVLADDTSLELSAAGAGPGATLGGCAALVDLLGYSGTLEACLTGRRFDAADALALGIAQRLAPAARLDSAVDDLARAVLAVPRETVTETKALLRVASGRESRARLAAERAALARLAADPAAAAG